MQNSVKHARRCDRQRYSVPGVLGGGLALAAYSGAAIAAGDPLSVLGIPIDFILFALTLLGVALFHGHTLSVALIGLAAIVSYKLSFTGFKTGDGEVKIALDGCCQGRCRGAGDRGKRG